MSVSEQACPTCGAAATRKDGYDRRGGQRFRCGACRCRFTATTGTPSSGYRFPPEIIALAVRWYLRYRLSDADVAEMLAERGVRVDPSSIYAWVQEFAPLYEAAARSCRRVVGERWSVDETDVNVAGAWAYAYRALDEQGQIVDVYVSAARATADAAASLRRAIEATGGAPTEVTTDCAAAYPPALAAVLPEVLHETGKRPQQRIERDHQHLKGRVRGMRGFKTVPRARVLCRAHAFLRNLRRGSYDREGALVATALQGVPAMASAQEALTVDLLTWYGPPTPHYVPGPCRPHRLAPRSPRHNTIAPPRCPVRLRWRYHPRPVALHPAHARGCAPKREQPGAEGAVGHRPRRCSPHAWGSLSRSGYAHAAARSQRRTVSRSPDAFTGQNPPASGPGRALRRAILITSTPSTSSSGCAVRARQDGMVKTTRTATPPRAAPGEGRTDVAPADPPLLQIVLLGGFRVAVGGHVVAPAAWRLDKGRSLVKLLALAPGYHLDRDRIMDLLWPDLDPAAAANNFHQALHVARRALTPLADAPARPPALILQRHMLTLQPEGGLLVDVAAFESAAAAARRTHDPADCAAALALYAGELLPEDRYEDWAAARREALRATFLGLLAEAASLAEARGAYAEARAALERLLVEEPTHEAAHAGLMRLFALDGQRQRALHQYARLRAVLRDDLDAAPDPASQRLYHAILARQFPDDAAASGSVSERVLQAAARHNLPVPPTTFVGRAGALAEVARLLGTVRLLTLTGTGGCGKTRLALAVATDELAAGTYPGGCWLVELAALRDPDAVPQAVATALGLREEPQRSLVATLANALRPAATLLVLDNCEHLGAACAALVGTLLGMCPALRVLATSRERLRLPGELAWRVPSLAVPAATPAPTVADLARSEAVQLFVARARLVQPDFALTAHTAAAIGVICRRVDGIPLALELAALRVPVLAVEQLAARLTDALRVLTAGDRTVAPRHQTLRATLDWSHDLLTAPERQVLRRLAVFAGGWTVEAAEAVCAGDTVPPAAVLELLARLVEQSLVVVETRGDAARYRLLEPVRQYADDRLRMAGEVVPTRRRHRDAYLALAEAAEGALQGPAPAAWLARLARERDNLDAALAWSMGASGDGTGDAATGLRLAGALWRFWLMRGSPGEGGRWLERLLAATPAPSAARAKALAGAGALAHSQGDYPRAAARTAESLALWRGLADQAGIAGALGTLAMVRKSQGDYPGASALFAEALALWRALGQPLKAAMVLNNLGALAYDQGAHEQAEGFLTASLAIKREAGDRLGIASTLINLAEGARFRGDHARAATLLAESLALFRALGNTPRIAHVLNSLGVVARARREHARAAALLTESLTLFRDLGNRWGITLGIEALGLLAADRGDAAPAARLLGAAAGSRAALGFPLPPVERAGYDAGLATVRAALGAAAFAAAWTAGQDLAPEAAIAEALRIGPPTGAM